MTADDLPRSPAQRRADALLEMARRAMAAAPGSRLPAPLITVLINYEQFHGPVMETLNNGTVLTPWQVATLLPDAEVERVVFGSPNRIIELGQRTRFFTGGLRRAIEIRDKHCTFPGCNVDADHCDVDHIEPYSQGGLTVQENGRLRCGPHNPSDNPTWDDRRSPPELFDSS